MEKCKHLKTIFPSPFLRLRFPPPSSLLLQASQSWVILVSTQQLLSLFPPSHIFPLLQYGSFTGCKGYLLWHLKHLLLLLLIWCFVFSLLFLTILFLSPLPEAFCPFLDMFFQRNWQLGHVLPEGLLESVGMGWVAPDPFSQRPPLQPLHSDTNTHWVTHFNLSCHINEIQLT